MVTANKRFIKPSVPLALFPTYCTFQSCPLFKTHIKRVIMCPFCMFYYSQYSVCPLESMNFKRDSAHMCVCDSVHTLYIYRPVGLSINMLLIGLVP